MQFCQSLNEQALELAEGPAEGIERILRQSRAHIAVDGQQADELEPNVDGHFFDVRHQDPTEPAEEPCGRSLHLQPQASAQLFQELDGALDGLPSGFDLGNDLPRVPELPMHLGQGLQQPQPQPQPHLDAHGYAQEFNMPQPMSERRSARSSRAHRDHQVVQRNNNQGVLDIAQQVENRNLSRMLDTPRTKEACKRTGILPQELRVKPLQEFAQIGDKPERQRMRFDHYENKRQEKLKIVLAERSRIMQEKMQQEMMGPAKGYAALQMMEELLDKEAKHQEKELRTQVRQQNTIEKENELQLAKEKKVKQKELELYEKRLKAEELRQARSSQGRTVQDAKEQHHKELVLRNEQELEMRQAGYLAEQLEEELRLRELQIQKQQQHSQKSEEWQQKMELMQQRQEDIDAERRAEGEALISNYQIKLEQMDKRREEELMEKMLKHEEKQLRIEDAMEKKQQLSRQDEHRRQQVEMQMHANHQRVDTFLSMKEQIQQQRKVRAQQQSAMKERAISLKSMMPGPADYYVQVNSLQDLPVPKISNAKPKAVEGSIDELVERQRKLPAPGAYDPKLLPNGKLPWENLGTKMVAGKKKTYLDEKMRDAKYCPGPGAYDNKSSLLTEHATAIRRDYMQIPEGRAPAWAQADQSCGPGPAAYAVDPFHRQRRLRAQKSLPVISKAMNLG